MGRMPQWARKSCGLSGIRSDRNEILNFSKDLDFYISHQKHELGKQDGPYKLKKKRILTNTKPHASETAHSSESEGQGTETVFLSGLFQQKNCEFNKNWNIKKAINALHRTLYTVR